jgi:hypothetical protein
MAVMSSSLERQQWLEKAVKELRPYIKKAGYTVPGNLRISWGWPKSGRKGTHVIGECFVLAASADEHHEIFISPMLGHEGKKAKTDRERSIKIIEVITHEIGHATLPQKAKHGKPFVDFMEAVGLEGKPTSTEPGPALVAWATDFIKKNGTFPAGKLDFHKKIGKQGTRMIKCECGECGYVARTTKKWIEASGAPHCGVKSHGRMSCDYEPEEEGEDE